MSKISTSILLHDVGPVRLSDNRARPDGGSGYLAVKVGDAVAGDNVGVTLFFDSKSHLRDWLCDALNAVLALPSDLKVAS